MPQAGRDPCCGLNDNGRRTKSAARLRLPRRRAWIGGDDIRSQYRRSPGHHGPGRRLGTSIIQLLPYQEMLSNSNELPDDARTILSKLRPVNVT